MKCPKCANEIPDQSRFCNFCGANLEQPRQNVEPVQYRQPQFQQPQQPQQPQFRQPVYQQPTYAQQVYQDRQTAMQYATPANAAPEAAKKEKKKFPVLAVVIAAAVLLVCAAALIMGLAFGKQTVYLTAEQVTEDKTSVTTYTYEYTEDGKLTFVQMEVEYKEAYSYMNDTITTITYTYDKKGKHETVAFELNGESYEYEYVYDKDGNLKTLEGDNQEFKIKCDDAGRITSVKSADDDSFTGKYSYHDNGILKKVSVSNETVEWEYRYNEQGKLLSNEIKYNGSLNSRTENKYDEDGNVLENVVESYSRGTLLQTTTTTYTYEDGMAVTYEIEISMDEGTAAFVFETEDDGLERTFEMVDIELSGEAQDEMTDEIRDAMDHFTIEMIYDEHGNLLELNMNLEEMGFSTSNSYSYMAVKVPGNYAMIYKDPIYFQSINPSRGAPAMPAEAAPAETTPMTEAPAETTPMTEAPAEP